MIEAYLRIEEVIDEERSKFCGAEADEFAEVAEVVRRLKEARISFEDGQRRLSL